MSPTAVVAYLALFAAAAFLLVFVGLLIGRFLRARAPSPEKGETYECGEPAVGSSYVQFDLRFYVVALLFIVFDVEVAFFFPWATVFGKATQMTDSAFLEEAVEARSEPGFAEPAVQLSEAARKKYGELGMAAPEPPKPYGTVEENTELMRKGAGNLALAAMIDISVFFAVLLVGFAYLWHRGDLDWVRQAGRRGADT
ncbi:MAG: NADH-quinone oxidoreductase subunit A [Planctomycetota bacterium]|jgi:NADH-quinone oxidoreductase subunit A